ncbi:hypothetical protein P6166_01255 [Stenotrophomonas sp. HITSZ_GD]|uniref:hypothetical protein n=1 Tax=Stenotrophomonas sp. HITSZ_GD TaxID=3037248 RepID=UPI00240D7568|nr:hypothetical protein [Stenotrophomonas sp. HITSZ_GD]MDG2523990.1 hypothetical protein [Stenotrophomonas sp. HITSZ_GD]
MNYVVFQWLFQRMTPLVKKTLAAVSHGHILQRSKLCRRFAPNTGTCMGIVSAAGRKGRATARVARVSMPPLE